MKVEITEQAVFILELTAAERAELEYNLRDTGGRSLIIPRKPSLQPPLEEREELELMIDCMRSSAQDTLAALRRRGVRLAKG
jgi:hypothetical protein